MSSIFNFGRYACHVTTGVTQYFYLPFEISRSLKTFETSTNQYLVIFEGKVVIFTSRNTNIYKICELRRAILSSFYNIAQPNFAILLIPAKMLFLGVVLDFVLLV
jgi:hypothetical protein